MTLQISVNLCLSIGMMLAFYDAIAAGLLKGGVGCELDPIADAVIGGRDSVLGCLTIAVLNNNLLLLEVSPFWQQGIKGLVILAAVVLDKMSTMEDA